jgi:hypothetical protein
MSTSPQKEETAQEPQLQEQEKEKTQSPAQTQDTEAGDEEQDRKMEDKPRQEEAEEEGKSDDNMEIEEKEQESKEEEQVKTPAKPVTPDAQHTPTQTKSTPKAAVSATKRKFDALHARSSAADPSISQHEKNKKARASALMKSPATRVSTAVKKATKTREFSFARPTMSSALRTEAPALDPAQAKARTKSAPPPAHKSLRAKRTPATAHYASTPGPKVPATDKTARAHAGYTPYTGPLPPLTVESSFAPKGSQMHTVSPAWKTAGSAARKPRPASVKKTSTGKENSGVNTIGGAASNAATLSSKRHRTPVKSSSVSKEESRSAFKEQQVARATPRASPEEPTA